MTIAVKESYLNTLRVFGDVNQLIDQAVEDFLTRRIIERIRAAREKIGEFEKKYGMPYVHVLRTRAVGRGILPTGQPSESTVGTGRARVGVLA